jgi:hypothetical protein
LPGRSQQPPHSDFCISDVGLRISDCGLIINPESNPPSEVRNPQW